ncbi:MAG TPA: class I SAM-dependent methyltransferase [Sphingobacteriaceae bacterium]
MILYKHCPLCNSENLEGYAVDSIRKGPHNSRVRCADCDIVFANPSADFEELNAFYRDYYDKGNFGLLNYKQRTIDEIRQVNAHTDAQLKKEASYISDYKTTGNFLDIGCGLGAGLIYARKLGFKLFGTELDPDAIGFVNEHFDAAIFHGDLLAAKYPDEFFDYIFFNHVIEHVLDPKAYIREIVRILKPGGILYIGTPNISAPFYRMYRAFRFASFRVPQIIDGIEHTFLFNKKTLTDICTTNGLSVIRHRNLAVGDSLTNIMKSDMSLKKKISRFVQTKFNVNQELICVKER